MALGGWIGGVIFDMMVSYDLALIKSVIASVAGAVSIVLVEPTNRLLIPDWEKEHLVEDEAASATRQVIPIHCDVTMFCGAKLDGFPLS